MTQAVIAVTTANRPEILDRCIASAVMDGGVASKAMWIVLDDSLPENLEHTREIAQAWKRRGVKIAYVDNSIEEEIGQSLPLASYRESFSRLMAKPPAYRIPGMRNLALLIGLSLAPEFLFFVDDDVVHRNDGSSFFDWCLESGVEGNFVAAPRKRGIGDMVYLSRILHVFERDDWAEFVRDGGITARSELWHSPENPLWKSARNQSEPEAATLSDRDIVVSPRGAVSTQLLAIANRGGEWLPFPAGHNEDLNWSILQSYLHKTVLLRVRRGDVQHLPPRLRYASADAIVSEMVGVAIARALGKIDTFADPRAQQSRASHFGSREFFESDFQSRLIDFKPETLRLLTTELLLNKRSSDCAKNETAQKVIGQILSTLTEAKERLGAVDISCVTQDWLADFNERRTMFSTLRNDSKVASQVCRIVAKWELRN